jgi:hypothetical protein
LKEAAPDSSFRGLTENGRAAFTGSPERPPYLLKSEKEICPGTKAFLCEDEGKRLFQLTDHLPSSRVEKKKRRALTFLF